MAAMAWLEPISLQGPGARLEPLSTQHLEDLIDSVNDGALWNLWYTTIPRPEDMRAEIERRLRLRAAYFEHAGLQHLVAMLEDG